MGSNHEKNWRSKSRDTLPLMAHAVKKSFNVI